MGKQILNVLIGFVDYILVASVGESTIIGVSLMVSLLMNIINISLNALFIFVFKLGVFGAGLATLIARIVAAIIMFVLICTKDIPLKLSKLYIIG